MSEEELEKRIEEIEREIKELSDYPPVVALEALGRLQDYYLDLYQVPFGDEFYELVKKVAMEIPKRFETAKRWMELRDELWRLKDELFMIRMRKAEEECSRYMSAPEKFLACLREKLKAR